MFHDPVGPKSETLINFITNGTKLDMKQIVLYNISLANRFMGSEDEISLSHYHNSDVQ